MTDQFNPLDVNSLPESVFIFGCGYVGSALAEALVAAGVRVGALTRNSDRAEALRSKKLDEVVVGNLHEPDWQEQVAGQYEGVVNCVSSAGGGLEGYRLSYLEGQRRILEWVGGQGKKPVYIYTSSTSVYPQDGGALVEETVSTEGASPTGRVLLESEVCLSDAASFLTSWYVLRLAGIYGPERHYLLDQIRDADGVVPGRGDYTMNMIHRDDAVGAILCALAGLSESGVYNICDDTPEHKEVVLSYLAEQLNLPAPRFNPDDISPRLRRRGGRMPDRIISNRKAREILGWTPKNASFRQGYVNLLENLDT